MEARPLNPPTPQRRWRLQFGLPMVFGLMTLVAVALTWRARQIEAERAAVGAVRKLHGAVLDGEQGSTPASAWERLWLRGAVRPEYISFRHSRTLFDQPERLKDLQPHLKRLGSLRSLSLEGTAIGDEQLPLLEDLDQIDTLNLRGTLVTYEGVARLRERLPGCKVVCNVRAPTPR